MTFNFIVPSLDRLLEGDLQKRLDSRTKPLGSLGRLERLALQAGLIQQSLRPTLRLPHIVVFAGDHGAVSEGISAYPQEVTAQMVANFLEGGAAINVLAAQASLALTVVDAGVVGTLAEYSKKFDTRLIAAKIAPGTANYLQQPAMNADQCQRAISCGMKIVNSLANDACNAIGFGEMGIGNSASASLLTHFLCDAPLLDVVGRGTGLDAAGVAHKLAVLARAAGRIGDARLDPLEVLQQFGGFEIAMMVGAYIAAAQNRMLIVVDGFISTAALLVAYALAPAVCEYCVFSHQSSEPGHAVQLAYLDVRPLVALDLRLGEGSGAALAFPIVRSALALMNDMAGFADAGVSTAGR